MGYSRHIESVWCPVGRARGPGSGRTGGGFGWLDTIYGGRLGVPEGFAGTHSTGPGRKRKGV